MGSKARSVLVTTSRTFADLAHVAKSSEREEVFVLVEVYTEEVVFKVVGL